MSLSLKMSGFKELDEAFVDLTKAASRGAMRRSLKAAGEPLADLMSSLAPVGPTGNLKESIVISSSLIKSAAREQRRANAGEKTTATMYVGPAYWKSGNHAHLAEFGTGPRYTTKPKKFTGSMPAQPFARPAWDQDADAMMLRLRDELRQEIEKSLARARRKAARPVRKGV